jgi:hypothetical protein
MAFILNLKDAILRHPKVIDFIIEHFSHVLGAHFSLVSNGPSIKYLPSLQNFHPAVKMFFVYR